jgi:hypothetical protein
MEAIEQDCEERADMGKQDMRTCYLPIDFNLLGYNPA